MHEFWPSFFNALFGVVLLLIAAKLLGGLARRFRAPSVVGELLVGLLLGPTILGPFAFAANPIFQTLVQIARLLFLLTTGGRLDARSALTNIRMSGIIAAGGMVLPFLLALITITVAPSLLPLLSGPLVQSDWQLTSFLGLALSISAVPVIAKILMDLGVYQSSFGARVMTAAVITDVAAWILYAFIGGAGRHGLITIGAFLLGTVLAHGAWSQKPSVQAFFRFNTDWLAPIFFASVGLKVDFFQNFDLRLVIIVFCLACIGKLIGCGLSARLLGVSRQESWAIATALNARGAIEIVLSLTALNQGLISPQFFEALVIMAFATSFMSGPLIRRSLLRSPNAKDIG